MNEKRFLLLELPETYMILEHRSYHDTFDEADAAARLLTMVKILQLIEFELLYFYPVVRQWYWYGEPQVKVNEKLNGE